MPTQHLRQILHERDEQGASAVEYGMLLAGVTAMIVIAVFVIGGLTQSSFADTCAQLKAHTGSAAACGNSPLAPGGRGDHDDHHDPD